METEIKIGDVVRIKSGGPDMTVKYIEKKEDKAEVCCQWFVNGKKHEDVFDIMVLTKPGAGVASIPSPFRVIR